MQAAFYPPICLVALGLALSCLSIAPAVPADAQPTSVYPDDPEIITILKGLGDNSSVLLPEAKGKTPVRSPKHRDYCNKMAWAADRHTALYAGGSHQTYRGNDVWEYHLGSHRWHELFAPDGGDQAFVRPVLYFGAVPKLAKDPKAVLSENEAKEFERAKAWWKDNAILKDGHVTTRKGGPIIPAHTWDAFTYDPVAKRLLWASGANPGGTGRYHAAMTGQDPAAVEKEIDPAYSPLWMFDPENKKWIHDKSERPRPELRGMGATMEFIPELRKSIYYVAAQNVSPADYGMWTFDAAAARWEELKPNGGKSISTLATKDRVAPLAEQQTAYSKKHRKLVAVIDHDTFAYDVAKNEWSHLCADDRIDAHDSRTVFAYDSHADVFLLADPRGKKLAAFSLKTNKWEIVKPEGAAQPGGEYGHYRGYYDPVYNALVIDAGPKKVWAYRQKK